jgi:hypothetical protein
MAAQSEKLAACEAPQKDVAAKANAVNKRRIMLWLS